MPRTDLTISAPDGECDATLHVPNGDGPWPGVVMFADAAGVRDTLRRMADQLARLGYAVLLPDVHYRLGGFAPFDMATVFSNQVERRRLLEMAAELTSERLAADSAAYIDALLARPETHGTAVGTTGYCVGGKAALIAAGAVGARVAAAASFHGTDLAIPDDPGSPHHHASTMHARVYVAGARGDKYFPPQQAQLLAAALGRAGVAHKIEIYPAAHGFAVSDNPTHDPDAEQRHWTALTHLYRSALGTTSTH